MRMLGERVVLTALTSSTLGIVYAAIPASGMVEAARVGPFNPLRLRSRRCGGQRFAQISFGALSDGLHGDGSHAV